MVGVALPCRKQGKSGTLHIFAGGDVQDRSRGRLIQLGGGTMHGPGGRQLQLLKGAEKDKTCFYVIRATRPAGMFGGPSVLRAQNALEEQLRARVPCVLQGHIRGVPQAERVGLENQPTILAHGALGAASLARDIPGYPVIYVYN